MGSSTIIIGDGGPIANAIEQGLIATGIKVAEVALNASQPWTKLPVVSWLVDAGIKFAITKTVAEADQILYQIYVSIKDATQVTSYLAAQKSGDQQSIDQAADNILKLEGV